MGFERRLLGNDRSGLNLALACVKAGNHTTIGATGLCVCVVKDERAGVIICLATFGSVGTTAITWAGIGIVLWVPHLTTVISGPEHVVLDVENVFLCDVLSCEHCVTFTEISFA